MPESEWLNDPIRKALMRGRGSLSSTPATEVEEDKPTGDFDAGVRPDAPPPPPGMNDHIRASIRAARREPTPEDYDHRL